ncbi:hypothetical protein PMAYCL1PPCAC_08478, partial [Pristionchus mayeri]
MVYHWPVFTYRIGCLNSMIASQCMVVLITSYYFVLDMLLLFYIGIISNAYCLSETIHFCMEIIVHILLFLACKRLNHTFCMISIFIQSVNLILNLSFVVFLWIGMLPTEHYEWNSVQPWVFAVPLLPSIFAVYCFVCCFKLIVYTK